MDEIKFFDKKADELTYWEKALVLFFRLVKRYWKYEACFIGGFLLAFILF